VFLHHAYRIAGNREDAKDILQETFLQAWKNFDKFIDGDRPESWIFEAIERCGMSWVREAKRMKKLLNKVENEQHLGAKIETDTCFNALDNLISADKYKILKMVYLEGYSQKEVAQIYGVSYGAMRQRIIMHRKELREKYEKVFHNDKKSCNPIKTYH